MYDKLIKIKKEKRKRKTENDGLIKYRLNNLLFGFV